MNEDLEHQVKVLKLKQERMASALRTSNFRDENDEVPEKTTPFRRQNQEPSEEGVNCYQDEFSNYDLRVGRVDKVFAASSKHRMLEIDIGESKSVRIL